VAATAADDAPRRSLRLGFAGTPGFAVPALDALTQSRHRVAAVFTKADRAAGRGQKLHVSPVKGRALALGLPVHQPVSFKESAACEELEALRLDALVVVAYGLILPGRALLAPRLGCFNIHASLLPRWRGAAPIQRAILAGDRMTGVSIMRMEEKLDTGPVLVARAIEIDPLETGGRLHERLAALGGELIRLAIDDVADGCAVETPQPEGGVTYAEKISKAEALIDWRDDADQVLRKVRAFNPSPIAETRWNGEQLRIWEAVASRGLGPGPGPAGPGPGPGPKPGPSPAGRDAPAPGTVMSALPEGIEVACGRGALRIERLQLAGRKPVTAAEFLRAHRLDGASFA
jgi:methionyl-tRNA formyltransferase